MFFRPQVLGTIAAFGMGLGVVSPAWAQDADAVSEPDDNVSAEAVVREALEAMGAIESGRVAIALQQTVSMGGQTRSANVEANVVFATKGRVKLVASAETDEARVLNTPETYLVYFPAQGEAVRDAPLDTRGLVVGRMGGGQLRVLSEWIGGWMDGDERLLANAGGFAFDNTFASAESRRVRFETQEYTALMEISAATPPLLRSVEFDLAPLLAAQPDPHFAGSRSLMLTASLSEWSIDEAVDEAVFAIDIPEEITVRQAGAGRPTPMLGEEAPDIKLPVFDGGEFDLASFEGENIVIVDFWASWCGPCRIGLPVLAEVAKQFEEEGVVFYTVNARENEGIIRGFLDSTGLDIKVAMDRSGSVQRAYQVTSLPRTLIIDKEGTIARVHMGVHPGLKADLVADINELLAEDATS